MDASNVKGAVDSDGNAYFNTDTMTMDTPIHEAGHIWNSITKNKNPELYAQGLTLIEEQGQEYIDYVKKTQPALQGEALLEEALAQAIGDAGAKIINEKRNSDFKQWLSDLFDWIGKQLGISQYTGEELQNFTLQQFSTAVAIEMLKGAPTTIETPSIFKPLTSIKESYEHSFVKPEDIIDIEGLVKDIISKGQTVSFWVGDQLGRGTYVDKFGNEHYLDGGISYALDPENRDRGVVWASGALEKNIKRLIKADYTFIISGSPKTSKLFNKKVFNIFSTRIEQLGYNYDSFKEKLVELKTPQSVVKYFNEFSSFEDLSNSPKRKEVLLKMISSVEGKKTDFANFIRDNGILPSSSGVTDGFLKENNFRINDVVLVLKLNSIGEQSTHSTYDKEILGEVIGVPDKIVNAYELLNPKKKKSNGLGESLKSQIIVPYGIGDAQNVFLGSRFSKQQNPFETPKDHPDPNKKAKFVKIGDVEISYNETDNHMHLQLIESKGNRNSGQATKAMQTLVDYADSKGKSIDLFAAPRDKQTSENRLMEFYKKFGFQPKFEDFPQEMIRYPKKQFRFSMGESSPPVWDNTNPSSTIDQFKDIIKFGKWGMLTGENPMGKTMSEIANYRANIRANTWLKERGYTPIEIKGMYEAPENSFFVQNLSVKDALDFTKEFNQESIATSEGFVYQDGTYNPRLPEQDSFGDTYEGYYSSINIAGNNVDFQVGYDFNSRLLIEPMNLENSDNYPNMTEDEEGNFVFNHWSAAKRDVIKPGQTGTKFTGNNEAGAWSNVGGAAYYYTKDGDREPGLIGGVGHQIKIPKERVYDFNSDRQKFSEEAEKLFKKDNPSIAYSFNHQIAYLTKVANNNGYLMTVAKWNEVSRAQTTLPLEVFDVYIPGPNNSVEKQFNNQYLSNLKKGIEKNKDKQYEPTIDGLRQLTSDFDSKYSPEKLESISGRLNDNNYTQIQKVFKSSIPESEKDKFFKVMHGAYPKAINFQPEHIQKRMREAINDNGSNDSGIRFSLAQRIIEDLAKNGNIDLNCML